jgi:membrane protease subunit (stomatin/prohibitin family)
MAFIDCIEWNCQRDDIFAWKYPKRNLTTMTQLIVAESQEAVFFSKGRLAGKFGPGKHQLSSENIPIIYTLFGLPFGGKNPFTADVWFVNKACRISDSWSTTPMRYMDPGYRSMIPLTAKGSVGFTVSDAEKFLVKLVGTFNEFDSSQMLKQCQGIFDTNIKSKLCTHMSQLNLGILNVSQSLADLTGLIKYDLEEFWSEYGVKIVDFFITSIDLDESTEEGRKIAQALSDRTAQNIAGYTWQQKQAFGTVNNVFGKGDLGSMGALMMMGLVGGGNGFGGGMGAGMVQPTDTRYLGDVSGNTHSASQMNQNGNQNAGPVRQVFCDKCGKKFPITSKFCPYCGDFYNACPVCGADNDQNAKRCIRCGSPMRSAMQEENAANVSCCARCGKELPPNVKFCPSCGKRV